MTIREYTEDAVRKYLRTVLLVDDRLFTPKSENATGQEDGDALDLSGIPDTSGSGMSSSDHEMERFEQSEEVSRYPLDEVPYRHPLNDVLDRHPLNQTSDRHPLDEAPSPSSESFSAQKVVDGFYRLGIVCGLYEPKTSEFSNGAVPQRLIDLCDHSDVFILDWKLKDNQADSPVPVLIEQLLSQDETCGQPRAVRFCAIYTDAALGTVFSALHTEIKARFPHKTAEEDLPNYRIHLGGLTIRLYRKIDAPEAAGNSRRFVSSSDLAKTIVKDFVTEYEGIMSATALHGIAEVRSNAKRILDKFHPVLDYAFAIHSGLTISDPTVPEDLSGLISDEISSLIQESVPDEDLVHELLAAKIDELPDSCFSCIASDENLVVPETTASAVKRYFVDLFRNQVATSPFVESEVDCKDHIIGRLLLEKLQSLALSVADSPNYVEGDLSKLFCQRTVYGNSRVLKPGTIVRESGSESYYLCLMPLCDSVRLKHAKVVFPFWKLSQIQNVSETTESSGQSSSGRGTSHGVIVSGNDGTTKRLCLKGKIKDKMSMWQFKADDVVQFVKEGSSFFISECQRGGASSSAQHNNQTVETVRPPKKFEWVAELKPLHAQRMAEFVSRQFSRVGLSESEWLRLQVDR